jgi:NADP-dependent aldehyde dehydrogenase
VTSVSVHDDSVEAVDASAIAATRDAGEWSSTPRPTRADALEAIAAALDAAVDELVELAATETALPEARLRGEVGRTTGQLRMFAERLRDGSYVEAIISPADGSRPDVRRMLIPIGPVGVFSASNFPFAFSVAGGDTASALAAGCPVVVKAHEGHPVTSRRTADVVATALRDAGAPDGVFGIVFGREAGRALVTHPAIKAVGFTGSLRGGRALFDLAAGRPDPIPFYGELGSVNPVVLLPGAVAERGAELARGYVGSLTLGVGQFCTNPGVLFAPERSGIVEQIGAEVSASAGGRMLTQQIRDGYLSATTAQRWTDLPTVGRGTGAGPDDAIPEVRSVPLADFANDIERLTEERFGPAGLVVTYRDPADLPAILRRLPGGLTASIHATDAELATASGVADALRAVAGRLIMNGWPTGVAVCWAMHHGGPWPATTNAAHTSVGSTAIRRWLIPIAYQDWPDQLLPPELQRDNPLGIARTTQP